MNDAQPSPSDGSTTSRGAVAVAVRAAGVADLPECVRLAAVMYRSVMQVEPSPRWFEAAAVTAAAKLADGSAALFVVDDPGTEGRLLACAAGLVDQHLPGPSTLDGRTGYVQWVCTDAAHRGRGLGRAVVQAVLDWLDARGVGKTELHASAEGEAMYRSMGFVDPAHPALRRSRPAAD